MRTPAIHFVYALPYRLVDKIAYLLFKSPLRRRVSLDDVAWGSPIKAPLSITHNLARGLSGSHPVFIYDLLDRHPIEPADGDILLAHPCPDRRTLVWKALDDPRFSRRILIAPYNHSHSQVAWLRELLPKVDCYCAISGDPWFDRFAESPLSDFADRIFQVHMAIETADYPLVKRRFNPAGRRRFFYVGRTSQHRDDEKGIALLESMAEMIPGFEGGYICRGGEIRGWKKISSPRSLDPPFVARIAEEYDFFLNMSRADAQVTTVLEAMSWGFPVGCTRESGYRDEGLFLLDLDDPVQNREVIMRMQSMAEEDLILLARRNRSLVETKYSWENFVRRVQNIIGSQS